MMAVRCASVTGPPDAARAHATRAEHQTRDGVDYPAVLLVHGMNDRRADVWQGGKAAARLQAASHSCKPVLLRIDEQAGHDIGSTIGQAISKQADVYAFLL